MKTNGHTNRLKHPLLHVWDIWHLPGNRSGAIRHPKRWVDFKHPRNGHMNLLENSLKPSWLASMYYRVWEAKLRITTWLAISFACAMLGAASAAWAIAWAKAKHWIWTETKRNHFKAVFLPCSSPNRTNANQFVASWVVQYGGFLAYLRHLLCLLLSHVCCSCGLANELFLILLLWFWIIRILMESTQVRLLDYLPDLPTSQPQVLTLKFGAHFGQIPKLSKME